MLDSTVIYTTQLTTHLQLINMFCICLMHINVILKHNYNILTMSIIIVLLSSPDKLRQDNSCHYLQYFIDLLCRLFFRHQKTRDRAVSSVKLPAIGTNMAAMSSALLNLVSSEVVSFSWLDVTVAVAKIKTKYTTKVNTSPNFS